MFEVNLSQGQSVGGRSSEQTSENQGDEDEEERESLVQQSLDEMFGQTLHSEPRLGGSAKRTLNEESRESSGKGE